MLYNIVHCGIDHPSESDNKGGAWIPRLEPCTPISRKQNIYCRALEYVVDTGSVTFVFNQSICDQCVAAGIFGLSVDLVAAKRSGVHLGAPLAETKRWRRGLCSDVMGA